MSEMIPLRAVIEMRYSAPRRNAADAHDVAAAESRQLEYLTQLMFGNDDDGTEVTSRVELIEEEVGQQ